MIVYLDSSALAKRYLEESGSASIDAVYERLEREDDDKERFSVAFSVWNLGEVVGAIDSRRRRNDLDDKSKDDSIDLLFGETRKFAAMRRLTVLPIRSRLLRESREFIIKHHMYQADALQLATAKEAGSSLLLTADKRLIECAVSEGMAVANPEYDWQKIVTALDELKDSA